MLDTQTIITTLAESMGIEPPTMLCKADCTRLEELSLKHISFLTFMGNKYESGELGKCDFIGIARDWEEVSGFAFGSRETYYKLKSLYLHTIVDSRPSKVAKGLYTIGVERFKKINEPVHQRLQKDVVD